MSRPKFDIGDTVRITATMTNYLGSPAMPATAVLRVMNPLGTVVASTVMTKVASGVYAAEHTIASYSGQWFAHVNGIGQAAEEMDFFVRRSRFS